VKKNEKSGKKSLVGREELSAVIGVSSRQISYYLHQGMPQEGRGKFDLDKCVEWAATNVKPTGRDDGRESIQPENRGFWETEKAKWQAKQAELDYHKQLGELIAVDDVAREQERSIAHAKALAEQVPDRLLGLLPKSIAAKAKKDFRAAAFVIIEDFLFALSDWELETIDDSDDDTTSEIEAAEVGGMAPDHSHADPGVVPKKRKAPQRSKQQSRKV
jgi:phage terminase Nu1 subunit (DNA packaging protein)